MCIRDRYGLELTSIGTGTAYGIDHLSLTSEEEEKRQGAVKRLKDHILTAADYDHAVVILGLIRGKVAQCSSLELYKKLLMEGLGECCDFAAQYGVTLGIELMNRYECDYVNNIDEGLEPVSYTHLFLRRVSQRVLLSSLNSAA